jgi:hypothetical protein
MADQESRSQEQNQEYEEPSLVDLEDVAGGGEEMMGVCDTGGSGSTCTSCDTGGSALIEAS